MGEGAGRDERPADREGRPAFYALSPGGWRDWWTLLHPPYTLWHLSYVAIGAATAPRVDLAWLGETLLAFFLAVGVAAHALDELHGRPLRTRIPGPALGVAAGLALAGAAALGLHGALRISPWLLAFVAAGAFLVLAYDLELAGGRFHTDAWFALAWGAFPAVVGAFAQTARITPGALVAAGGCAALSAAQRALSSEARRIRRRAVLVRGEVVLDDGTREEIGPATLRRAPEGALRALSAAVPLLAAGLVIARA
ncbi:MAG TPA: hypothetical protein VNO79_06030 [Actinomycetota bacterium]|nr:hypothetical protein [Actinomycetota bacterium]